MMKVYVRTSMTELCECVGSSNNGGCGLGKRNLCQRYREFFKFFACQNLDLCYYGADHDIQRFKQ